MKITEIKAVYLTTVFRPAPGAALQQSAVRVDTDAGVCGWGYGGGGVAR